MKKMFALAFGCFFAVMSAHAESTSESNPEASPEPQPVEVAAVVETPAQEPQAEVYKASMNNIPDDITNHLNLRFPGRDVQGITREGHTYLVDLGDGLHIRYDNCCNPVCYGDHTHE